MENLTTIWDSVQAHIDAITVGLVLLGGFFSKRYLNEININNALKTLIVGTMFTTVYIIILKMSGQLNQADYVKYFVSYCVATSLYEILIRKVTDFIGDKFKTKN